MCLEENSVLKWTEAPWERGGAAASRNEARSGETQRPPRRWHWDVPSREASGAGPDTEGQTDTEGETDTLSKSWHGDSHLPGDQAASNNSADGLTLPRGQL